MYIFYLHIHVKIQCWFPLDQRVRRDSQVQFVLRTEMLTGLTFPPGHCPNTSVYMKWFESIFSFFPSCTAEKYILTCFFIQIIGLKYYVKLWWRSPNVSGWILWFFLKRACLCAPKLLLGTAEHWEGLLSIPQLTPPGPGCWCSHLTG